MSGVLVYSERDPLAHDLLAWAATNATDMGPITAVVLGAEAKRRAETYRPFGAQRIFAGEAEAFDNLFDGAVSDALEALVEETGAELILLGSTRRGRSLAPRLAQRLNAGCVSEAIEIGFQNGNLQTGRYSLGGNTIAHERITTPKKVIAIVPGTLERASPGEPTGEIQPLPVEPRSSRASIVERREKPPAQTDIAESERLVCIGRGLAQEEDLPILQDLAEALGADLACTRPLSYEYGWLSEERMVGISGARCSPQLMVSVGVSGQVQHTVGIMGSRVIVAINNDAGAPIFQLTDYGIIGDLYEIAPALAAALRERA